MKAYHNSVVLRNDGQDTATGKFDLNAGVTKQVTVRINSSQALAIVYDLGEVQIANPVTTDSNGNYKFKANDDIYDVIISEGQSDEYKIEKVEIVEVSSLINDLSQAYEFTTLEGDIESAIESLINLPVGKKIKWEERKTGSGGGGSGVIALTSVVTPNTFDVIVSVGDPTKSVVLSTKSQTVELDQLGANIGDGHAAIQYAVDNYQDSIANSPLYNVSNVVNVPSGHKLKTNNLSKINATSDTVAVVVQGQFAVLDGFLIETTFGAHTKNLVEVGAVGFKADRSRVANLIITGAGNDGLQIKNGNLGAIENVASSGNGRDGINFEHGTSADNQNWAFEGFVDAISNGRDGVNFEAGSSVGDAFSSRKHHGSITCQQNGRYGFYCGTAGHDLVIYSENNTTQNVFLDQFGMGSRIHILEGAGFTETTPGSNIISVFSMNADNIAGYKTTIRFSGGATGGFQIDNDDGTSGVLLVKKTGAREITYDYSTSSSAWQVLHINSDTGGVNTAFDGNINPHVTDVSDCGLSVRKWKDGWFSGTVTAGGFTPFTGIHLFYSDTAINVGLAVDLVDGDIRKVDLINRDTYYTETLKIMYDRIETCGKVTMSQIESKVCAGVVSDCIKGDSEGFVVMVAAVGDNRSGKLKGFKIDECEAGDILCTSSGGAFKVAPLNITREVVTFKAMSSSVNGIAYGYF